MVEISRISWKRLGFVIPWLWPSVSIDETLVRMVDMKIVMETRGEATDGQTIALLASIGKPTQGFVSNRFK